MNVAELIEELQKLPPDLLVVIQKDPEGNGYYEARGADGNDLCYDDSDYEGSVGFSKLTEEKIEKGYTEEDLVTGIPCVVIYP